LVGIVESRLKSRKIQGPLASRLVSGEGVTSFWARPEAWSSKSDVLPRTSFQRLTEQQGRAESKHIFPETSCRCSAAIYAKEVGILFIGGVFLLLSRFSLAASRSLICFTSSKKRSGSRSSVASAQSLYQRSSVSLFIVARLKHRIRASAVAGQNRGPLVLVNQIVGNGEGNGTA
jgi:hypothetical protein